MFAEIFRDIAGGKVVEHDLLGRRFDIAMTKKLGVVKLPPSFWMQDSKINPRADHLLWAALLLDDAERVALAFSVLAVEHEEQQQKRPPEEREPVDQVLDRYMQQLLALIPKEKAGQQQQIRRLVDDVRP